MARLKAEIKYNDGIWREQYLPLTTHSFEMYNDLLHFKELGYIRYFKLLLVKQVNNKTIEVDIKDLLDGSSGVNP